MGEREFDVIGRSMPRIDTVHKVTGRTQYLDDMVLPRMLYGKIVRSPYAHARIVSIDASAALALPGVKAVLTGADMPPVRLGYRFDNRPLMLDKVHCVGDGVAAVAAVDRETAEEAAELVRVEYAPLPAVLDPEEAMLPTSPLVHEEQWLDALGKQRAPRSSNVSLHFHFAHGDPERALQQCEAVVEEKFVVPWVTSATIETMGCIATWDAAGDLTMYSPTQVPFLYQREMADALGISGGRVRVIGTPIGGAFGKNLEAHPFEVACAVLARRTGRPVKIVYTRQEEFINSRPRQPHIMYVRAGARKDGRLWVRTCRSVLDNGAYNAWGALTPLVTMQTFTSFYRVPHSQYDAYVVYTNNPYSGSMRGYGNPEGIFAVEQTMDMLAERLGMDPVEFRRLNANQPGEVTPQKMQITSCGLTECLEDAARALDLSARHGQQRRALARAGLTPGESRTPLRGVGIAGLLHVAGGARIYRSDGCGAIVKIDDFGRVTVLSGASDLGEGSDTTLSMIVAEELGVALADIRYISRDTAIVPWDVGTHASRATFIGGNACRLAARDAKEQLLAAAADLMGVPAADLDTRDRHVFQRSNPANRVGIDKVVRALHFREKGNVIIGHAFYDPPTEMQDKNWNGNISASYAFGAQAAEVEVDPETGAVRVLKVAAAHDVGKAINPRGVEGQIDGGVLMGVGYALTEELKVREGQVQNSTFMGYGVLSTNEAPEVVHIIRESGDPEGPFGAKGVAEATVVPTAAAIANAVADAIGVRITSLPITPEKVLAAMKQKATQTATQEAEGE